MATFAMLALALQAGGARGETVRDGGLQVYFGGRVTPQTLPRRGTSPVSVSISGRIRALAGGPPSSLRRIAIEINRLGVLDRRGLPVCRASRLRALSTAGALATCGSALVGEGRASGVIVLPEQSPTPFSGRIVAFNATVRGGRPAILAHLFSTAPAPSAFLLAFVLGRGRGEFGTRLVATVPPRTRRIAHISTFSLRLHRIFSVQGERRSYLSAGCPAPAGFPAAPFPLVRSSFSFDGSPTVSDILVRSCRVRGRPR